MRLLLHLSLIVSLALLPSTGRARSDETLPGGKEKRTELVLQLGHSGYVNALAFSPDGKTLASAGNDTIIRLSDARSGEIKQVLSGNLASVQSLKYSPDSSLLASLSATEPGDYSGELVIFDVHTLKILRTWPRRGEEFSGSNVTAFAFSPDNKTIALASRIWGETEQSQITLWDIASGKLQGTIATLKQKVRAITFSQDGKSIAAGRERDITGSQENSIANVWDVATRKLVRTFKSEAKRYPQLNDDGFYDIAFAPDGKNLAASSIFGEEMGGITVVWLWDMASGKLKRAMEVPGFGMNLAFSRDGKTIVSSGGMWAMGHVVFWDAMTGKRKRVLEGTCAFIPYFALSPDGKTLATSGLFPTKQVMDISDATFSIGAMQLWNVTSGLVFHTMPGHQQTTVRNITSAPSGSFFATLSNDPAGEAESFQSNARLWNAKDTRLQTTLPATEPFAISANGKWLAMSERIPGSKQKPTRKNIDQKAGSSNGSKKPGLEQVVALRDAKTRKQLRYFKTKPTAIAFSPDDRMIAVQSLTNSRSGVAKDAEGGALRIWNLSDGKLRYTMKSLTMTPGTPIIFSPDGTLLANIGVLPGQNEENVVEIWDTKTGKLRTTLKGGEVVPLPNSAGICSIAFAANGKIVIGRSTSSLSFWDVATGKRIRTAVSPHDFDMMMRRSDAAGPGETPIYPANADVIIPERDSESRAPMAVSPDGKIVVTEADESSLKFWDARTGEPIRELKGHDNGILSLAFLPDSTTLISSAKDGTMKFWNSQTGDLLLTTVIIGVIQSKTGRSTEWISYTPDGFYDGSAGAEKFIRWRVGEQLFPSSKLKTEKHRPDLIRQALAASH